MYRLFVFFCCFTIATCVSEGLFLEQSLEYFEECRNQTDGIGNVTVFYMEMDSNVFGNDTMALNDSLNLDYYDATYVKLMLIACVCTELEINTYEFFVAPFFVNEMTDALTLCVYHDDDTLIEDVLQIPIQMMEQFMLARYATLMPRKVDNMAINNDEPSDCLNLKGMPSSRLPGQNTCFYYSYVSFIKVENITNVIEDKSYNGPFLATNLPNFTTASEMFFNNSVSEMFDFATELGFVTCAVYKNKTRLDTAKFKRCFTKYVATDTLAGEIQFSFIITACCCIMYDDKDCQFVSKGLKEHKTLCYNGTLTKSGDSFFAQQCGAKIVRNYEQILDTNHVVTLEAVAQNSRVKFGDTSSGCNTNVIRSPILKHVNVTVGKCCAGVHFCNYPLGMNVGDPKCFQSFAEHRLKYGCPIIYYKGEKANKWSTASPLWFDREKSKLIFLYNNTFMSTITKVPFEYKVYLAYLHQRPVFATYPQYKSIRPKGPFLVLSCFFNSRCDYHIIRSNTSIQFLFDEFDATMAVNNFTRCEDGHMNANTSSTNVTFLPPITKRVYGLYCQVTLKEVKNNIQIIFEPVYPKPINCNQDVTKVDDTTYRCCHDASANLTYVDPRCHHSTIWAKHSDSHNVPHSMHTDVSVKQLMYELVDECEQRRVGILNMNRRQCSPGGYGCFHLLQWNSEKTDVIASCIGQGENKIASDKDAYDTYGAALICATPESVDVCQVVYLNGKIYFACCCHVNEVNDRVHVCKKSSSMLFHEVDHELKKIGRFKST